VVEILKTLAGGENELRRRPITQHSLEPISPLRYGTGLDAMFEFAAAGLPIIVGALVQTMISGPATLAGTAAQCIAENLAGLVIIQRIQPGTPISLAAAAHATNPRSITPLYGSPEQGLLSAAITQVIKSYDFPAYANSGYGDAKIPDAQSGLEKGMTLLLGAMAGADSFGHAGVAGTVGGSLVQLVVDDEMIAYLRRVMRGFSVSQDTLAFDVIKSVGIGGTFAAEEHTVEHLRREYWEPRLFEWDSYEKWIEKGRIDLRFYLLQGLHTGLESQRRY
jgi:trimethylamine--corrinoid protein Co-methyltransferase